MALLRNTLTDAHTRTHTRVCEGTSFESQCFFQETVEKSVRDVSDVKQQKSSFVYKSKLFFLLYFFVLSGKQKRKTLLFDCVCHLPVSMIFKRQNTPKTLT